MWETWVRSLGRENPLEKGMTTHFSILVGEFHGQRSLAGYSPWGHKELDTTEPLTLFVQRVLRILSIICSIILASLVVLNIVY